MNIFLLHLFFFLQSRRKSNAIYCEAKEERKKRNIVSYRGLGLWCYIIFHRLTPWYESVSSLVYFPLCFYSNIRCVRCLCYYYCTYHYYNVDVVLSSVIGLLRMCSAHVSLKKALPKVRLGHAFARLFSRSSMVLRNIVLLNWGILLVAMVTNALWKVRDLCRENALWKVRQKLS